MSENIARDMGTVWKPFLLTDFSITDLIRDNPGEQTIIARIIIIQIIWNYATNCNML